MPIIGALLTKAFWGLLFTKAKTNAVNDWHAVPPKVRLYIIGAIGLVVAGLTHQLYAKHQLKKSYHAGYVQAQHDDDEKLKSANARIEALNVAIAADERKKNDAKVAAIGAHADAVRLHGPGKAVCPSLPAAPGRPQPGPGPVTGGLDRVPYPEWQQLLGVPFDDAVGFAKQCDVNAQELRSWHSWYNRLAASWAKPK